MKRYTSSPATALLTAGVLAGLAGLHPRVPTVVTRTGLLLSIAAQPAVIARQLHRSHQATTAQLDKARIEGYRMALGHVARGLLDQPRSTAQNLAQPKEQTT